MPPRIPRLRSLCTIPLAPLIRRPLSTAVKHIPASTSRNAPLSFGGVLLGGGLAFYLFSHPSNAETQSSKTSSTNGNREAHAAQSQKTAENPGRTEMHANRSEGLSQDNKRALAVDPKKAEMDADKDSKTEEIKGSDEEGGQTKDDKVREKSEGKTDQGK